MYKKYLQKQQYPTYMQHHYKELRRELASAFDFVFEDEVNRPCSSICDFLPSFHLLFAHYDPNLLAPSYGLLSRSRTL